jgi:hypothetical protein
MIANVRVGGVVARILAKMMIVQVVAMARVGRGPVRALRVH